MLLATLLIVQSYIFASRLTHAVPIDNGLEGEPQVECGGDAITVYFQTRNPFHGHVFAKGFYDDINCRADYSPLDDNRISIRIPTQLCGVRRLRSVNPPGLYQSVTVVVTFHPLFVTKVDRALNLNCFYMEAEKRVTQAIDVSMLPTEVREISVAMPPCRYEVLNYEPSVGVTVDSSYLTPVRYARVGQSVLHKWQCNTDTLGLFCMTVHSCTVDDGLGHSVQILDERGCALDKYILGNLQYVSETAAQRESHVFKYADKTHVYFQCQISLSFKNSPQEPCARPVCPEPTRGKRQPTPNNTYDGQNADHRIKRAITDVSSSFAVLEIDEDLEHPSEKPFSRFHQSPSEVCLNAAALGLFVTLFGILATAIIIVIVAKKGKRGGGQGGCIECIEMKKVIA